MSMLCGGCLHPMHWHECGVNRYPTTASDPLAPCGCRNDVATSSPDVFDDAEPNAVGLLRELVEALDATERFYQGPSDDFVWIRDAADDKLIALTERAAAFLALVQS